MNVKFPHRRLARSHARTNAGRIAIVAAAVILTASVAAAARTPTGGITVRNLMPDFWTFWRAAQDRPSDLQLQLWQELYQQPNAAVFADLNSTCGKDLQADVLEKQYFPLLKHLIPAMQALSASLPDAITSAETGFIQAFPDMDWQGPIFIMASVGCFNGRSQLIQRRQALLLGVDDMAALHETNARPLITHEMFHRYHYSHFAFEPELPQPVWVRLWAEGLATFVAHELNPGASTYELTWISPEDISRMDSQMSFLAARLIQRADSTSQADAAAYFSDDGTNKEIPPRAGYYVGLEVAEYLVRRYPMQAMAHWNHEQAKPHILQALRHIERAR